jgi:hypothetical protein
MVNGIKRTYIYHHRNELSSIPNGRLLYNLDNYKTIPNEFFLLYSWIFYGAMKLDDKIYFSHCVLWGEIVKYRYILIMCLLTTCSTAERGYLVYDTECSNPSDRVYILKGK